MTHDHLCAHSRTDLVGCDAKLLRSGVVDAGQKFILAMVCAIAGAEPLQGKLGLLA